MVSPPAEQKQLLLKSLESVPSTEHERFLGETLYPLVQVHTTRLFTVPHTRHLVTKRRCPGRRVAGGGSGARRKNHRHAARAGRTPQRAQDRRPHCLPRHGALDLARQPLALAHPPGYAWCRSYWTSSMRRKRCWIVQTLLAATNPTHPTPILASSQLTVLRHVSPRAYSILGHVFFRDEPFSQATLSARRRHWRC